MCFLDIFNECLKIDKYKKEETNNRDRDFELLTESRSLNRRLTTISEKSENSQRDTPSPTNFATSFLEEDKPTKFVITYTRR